MLRLLEKVQSHEYVVEAYVLVREVRLFLDFGVEGFHPEVGVKIWQGTAPGMGSYSYSQSHYVRTPTQANTYVSSRQSFETEEEALEAALDTITSFVPGAIGLGHTPSEDWFVRDEDY